MVVVFPCRSFFIMQSHTCKQETWDCTLTPQFQGELLVLCPSLLGKTNFRFLWLLAWHHIKSSSPHPDDWEMASPLSPQQHWGVLGCVSSILWELTFPLLFLRRKPQLLLAICSHNTACQLACHIMPAWKQVCSPVLY